LKQLLLSVFDRGLYNVLTVYSKWCLKSFGRLVVIRIFGWISIYLSSSFLFFLEKRIQTSLPRLALASASRKSESYYNPSFEQMVSEPKVFAQNLVIVPVVSENHLQDSKKSREAN
jgi:hypothetical protein